MTKYKCIAISDTHTKHHNLFIPKCDFLIHAGDFCSSGKEFQVYDFADWFEKQPARHKVCIAGNHDRFCEIDVNYSKEIFKLRKIHYLLDEMVELDGVKIYGSPWQPEFCNWSFNLPRNGSQLKSVWNNIPENTDILITHGPPYSILDTALSCGHVGCELLLDAVKIKKPKYHIFGHIHREHYDSKVEIIGETTFINASSCDDNYRPINKPIEFEIEVT